MGDNVLFEILFRWVSNVIILGLNWLPTSDSTMQTFRTVDMNIIRASTIFDGYMPVHETIAFADLFFSMYALWFAFKNFNIVMGYIKLARG